MYLKEYRLSRSFYAENFNDQIKIPVIKIFVKIGY